MELNDLDNLPVYEPGLSEIVEKVRDKNLFHVILKRKFQTQK